MKLNLFEINCFGDQWWIAILNLETYRSDRSFLYIEFGYGVFKLQLLWLKNYCWVFDITK